MFCVEAHDGELILLEQEEIRRKFLLLLNKARFYECVEVRLGLSLYE